jgi:hypothetical protein
MIRAARFLSFVFVFSINKKPTLKKVGFFNEMEVCVRHALTYQGYKS